MEATTAAVRAFCPPHHWVIGNETTDEGTLERWRCQRCGAVRERAPQRRRPLADAAKRYVGEGETAFPLHRLGFGGERVA